MINTTVGFSRLNELRKLKQTTVFTEKYKSGGSFSVDGVDYNNSTPENVVYYIDNIKYIDMVDNTTGLVTTTVSFTPLSSIDTITGNMFKTLVIDGEYTQPKITNDVFIFREVLSGYKDNYLLNGILNMEELTTFAGGRYFSIKNNT